jgi:hypothetical protein
MAGFRHDIAGGQGNLIAGSFQSPNFVSGSTGWQVTQAGNAEFNDGVFRGTLDASVFELTNGIINSDGIFLYSATPASGNLIFSIASSAGTDDFGNSYIQGIVTYGASGSSFQITVVDGLPVIGMPPAGTTYAAGPPQIYSGSENAGDANEYQVASFFSGEETGSSGNSALQLFTDANDGSSGARGSLVISGDQVLGWNADGVSVTALEVDGNAWSQQPVPAAYPAVGSPSNEGLGIFCNQIVEALVAAGIMS